MLFSQGLVTLEGVGGYSRGDREAGKENSGTPARMKIGFNNC